MAEAFVCAANSAADGSRPVFIADHKNMLGIPTAPLAELCYPGAAVRHEQLPGFDAVVDYRAAERLIGFRAKHTFRDYYAFLYGEDPAWDTLS